MRQYALWAIHPKYLDNFALKMCWDDAIEVKNLILTKRNHEILKMFLAGHELDQIKKYLLFIHLEGIERGLDFPSYFIDQKIFKFTSTLGQIEPINLSQEQLKKERQVYLSSLKRRDSQKFSQLLSCKKFDHNLSFRIKQ